MQGARARQSRLPAVQRQPRPRSSDRRAIRRTAGVLCLLLALYCLLAAAVSLAQTPTEPDARPPLERSRLPLLISLIFLVFLVVAAAVARSGRQAPAGLPNPRPRGLRRHGRPG